MPYIVPEQRESLDDCTLDELCRGDLTAGELAYCLYRLMSGAMRLTNYASRATVAGVAATVMHEFLRRHLDPYEDQKRAENGPC